MFSLWNHHTNNRQPRQTFAQRRRQAAARRARHRLLGCEYLEDRRLLAVTIVVTPATVPTAVDNDFTRLQIAVGSVTVGDTVDIQGTFDWTETNAAASYAASTATSATADIRGIELPAGVNDVTVTSSTNDAHIIGRGDNEDLIFDSFLFADDGPSVGNTNFTLEKLNIDDFENAVMFGWNGTGTFTGTKIRDNTIVVAGDDFDLQNIAIYFAAGTGQQITGNTVSFQGDGTRVVGSGARSFGFQNNTTGGTGYDNLLIDDNTFQLLASSTGVENAHGIWDNGHNDDNSSDISITNNRFLGRMGIDDFDRALLLSSQTSGLAIDGNAFTDVDNVFYASSSQGHVAGDQFAFTNNVLTRVGGVDGIFLQNVTNDATPVHVIINWNINNTIDTFTGIRGLNELSTQATGASRPLTAATDLDAVNGIGTVTTAFVDDNWSAAGRFTDPDGIGTGVGPVAYIFNGFSTIQAGIDAVAAAGTVNVLAGTYSEQVNVNKSLTLSGANATADPTDGGARVAESIIVPPVSDANPNATTSTPVVVTASNVTINGFTIDGNNSSITSGATLTAGGDTDADAGVRGWGEVDHVTLQNNIIRNVSYIGADFGSHDSSGAASDGAPAATVNPDNVIDHNLIQNVGYIDDEGTGVRIRNNFYAAITNNDVESVRMGIETGNFSAANTGAAPEIGNNEIQARRRGVFYNLHYSTASAIPVHDNIITATADPFGSTLWTGVYLISQQGTVTATFQNNSINGTGSTDAPSAGYTVLSTDATTTSTISGGTVTNVDYGVWVRNVGPNGFGDATAAMDVTISGVSITAATNGVWVEDNAGNAFAVAATIDGDTNITTGGAGTGVLVTGADASADINNNSASIHGNLIGIDVNAGFADINNNHIYDNTTGIRLTNGGTATIDSNDFEGAADPDNVTDVRLDTTAGLITGGTLTGNTFAGTSFYIDNQGPQDLTALATLNTYNTAGVLETDNAVIESRIFHRIDNAASGLVTWVAGNLFVTPATSPTATDNDFTRLQNAVGSVTTGDTVDIQGTFDWTETNAAASYAASTATSATADIRGIELPAGVNDVTITSSTNDAHIIGRGDFQDLIFDSFLFADDGPSVGNTNFTLEKLNIDDFENAVMFGWNGTGTFTGTKIRDNTIVVAGDDFDLQNIAIYFAAGTGQQVTGNTVNFQGDGTRVVGSGARSFGFQNNTTGGALYDNLLIDDNTFQLLPSSTGVEIMHGIWENGDNNDDTSNIAITNNRFLGRTGVDDFDRALFLTSQTDALLIDGNTFTDVDNVLFSRNAAGGVEVGDEFTFTNNLLTRVGGADGIFLRNVTDDAIPIHVTVNWNSNNTIDGFTGIRGLNELSTQATGTSRPLTAASDIDAVNGIGTITTAFVDDNWGAQGRFTDPDGVGAGLGPIAFSFNTFDTIQAGVDAVAPSGTVNVLAGTYAESVNTSSKAVTLSAQASDTGQVTINGDLTLDANDTLAVQINGATEGASYDQWIVNGMVILADATLSASGTRTVNPGDVIVLIKNDSTDAVTGTFLGQPELAIVFINSVSYAITYKYNAEAGTFGDGNDVALIDTEFDYGDAPDPTYPTLFASDGARHVLGSTLFLGASVDGEPDGQPNATATGDDFITVIGNGSLEPGEECDDSNTLPGDGCDASGRIEPPTGFSGTPAIDDEDGVTFGTLRQGRQTGVTVVASEAGKLDAFVDFNADGDFADAGEKVFDNVSVTLGSNDLAFRVPSTAEANNTYARFRISSSGSLSFNGSASDGEVEDYAVRIKQGTDLGDAPDTYATLLANNGARHLLGGPLFLGAVVDGDVDGQPNATATGDDNNFVPDDEDGVTFGTLRQGRQTGVTVVASANGKLDAFVDFNADGDFADTGEKIFHNLSVTAGTNSLTFRVPSTAADSNTFARFRISTAGGLTLNGLANDGEVEDYAVRIKPGTDFGDAPLSYATTLANNGARHLLGSPLFMGAVVDGDSDGQPNATATGDDSNPAPNDEDGVTLGTLRQGRITAVTVVASASGKLDAFVDFNADGDFADIDEKIFDDLSLAAGTNSLTFRVPSTAADSNTFARFRISTAGDLSYDGLANDGEVEDYAVRIKQGTDLGDAPDTYATLLASNGARHLLGSALFMGTLVDGDQDGQANATASGDDDNYAPDDEDGVTFDTLIVGGMANVTVTASAAGKLDAFADFNHNGSFADAGEKIFDDVTLSAGINVLNFTVPDDDETSGQTFFRFRVSTVGGLSFNGLANDGEVEDYRVNVQPFELLLAAGGEASSESRVESLEPDQLAPIVDAAITRLAAQGLSPQQLSALSSLSFAVADLPGATLGLATPRAITLDATAAGYGWFIDPTPLDDSEFSSSGSRPSTPDSRLRMDLLTAVMHELGHTLGRDDLHDHDSQDDLMYEALAVGVRRTSFAAKVDAVFGE